MSLRLAASHISKRYNTSPILDDCSYFFEPGGVNVLIGPNGTGKSTFLRILALLETPDEGQVLFYNGPNRIPQDIHLRRRITLVLPKVGVFNTTVFKNVVYGLRVRGMKGDEVRERARRGLDFVGLLPQKNQAALTLSSGETQRLGLARALVLEPEILFLDEPTASVDQKNTEIIENILLKLKQEGRSTIIMSTHDPDQTSRLADRVLKLSQGHLQVLS